jgi:hypothetical protein
MYVRMVIPPNGAGFIAGSGVASRSGRPYSKGVVTTDETDGFFHAVEIHLALSLNLIRTPPRCVVQFVSGLKGRFLDRRVRSWEVRCPSDPGGRDAVTALVSARGVFEVPTTRSKRVEEP